MPTIQNALGDLKDKGAFNTLERITKLTADDLDRLGGSGETTLASGYRFDNTVTLPTLPGGWKVMYVGVREDGRYGKLILQPDSQWAQHLWEQGQKLFVSKYLDDPKHQDVWMKSRIRGRYDVKALERIAQVLNDPRLLALYLHFNTNCTSEEGMQWDARNDVRHHLHPLSRVALASLVQELVNSGVVDYPGEENRPTNFSPKGKKKKTGRGDVASVGPVEPVKNTVSG